MFCPELVFAILFQLFYLLGVCQVNVVTCLCFPRLSKLSFFSMVISYR